MAVSFGDLAGGIRIGTPSDGTVTIGDDVVPFVDGDGFFDLAVMIEAPGLRAEAFIRFVDASLHRFLRRLADDWKGEERASMWEAGERGRLRIAARRDSLGHVLLTFSLREGDATNAWRAELTVQLEAGEEMDQLSKRAEVVFGRR